MSMLRLLKLLITLIFQLFFLQGSIDVYEEAF